MGLSRVMKGAPVLSLNISSLVDMTNSTELEKLNGLNEAVTPHAFSILQQYQCWIPFDLHRLIGSKSGASGYGYSWILLDTLAQLVHEVESNSRPDVFKLNRLNHLKIPFQPYQIAWLTGL